MSTAEKTTKKKTRRFRKIKRETCGEKSKDDQSVFQKELVSKLRIRVRAYEHKVLDASVKQIIDTALRYDAEVVGPIPLPTEIKKYTVNRVCVRLQECARTI